MCTDILNLVLNLRYVPRFKIHQVFFFFCEEIKVLPGYQTHLFVTKQRIQFWVKLLVSRLPTILNLFGLERCRRHRSHFKGVMIQNFVSWHWTLETRSRVLSDTPAYRRLIRYMFAWPKLVRLRDLEMNSDRLLGGNFYEKLGKGCFYLPRLYSIDTTGVIYWSGNGMRQEPEYYTATGLLGKLVTGMLRIRGNINYPGLTDSRGARK